MPSFPYKLHTLLETVTSDKELSSIISWLPDGKSFRIHSQEEFERRVLREFFPRQKQVKSFMRQLQYYNFENFGDGLFCHPCFRRGQRNLCGQILHQLPTKSQKACGNTTRPLKQRGRKKKKADSKASMTASSPEPSLPDDASAFSASSSEDKEAQLEHGRDQTVIASPTAFKQVSSGMSKTQPVQRSWSPATLPMYVFAHQQHPQVPMFTPQLLAQYEMQAIQAARSNYLSCLQQELMLGSILYSKNKRQQQQSSQDGKVPATAQSMPAGSVDSTTQS